MPNGSNYYDYPPPSEPIESVWLAYWHNGMNDERAELALIGVYTTKEKAKKDAEKYKEVRQEGGKYPKSFWYWFEVSLDKPIMRVYDYEGHLVDFDRKE
jgi:hypothetical protein